MLLSQAGLGPLPPSPPSSSPEPQDSDEFPPLPPSPTEEPEVLHQMHGIRISSRNRSSNGTPNGGSISKHDQLLHGYREQDHPPAIPPHRGPSINTLKTRSMDAGFSKSYRNGSFGSSTSPHAPGTLPPDLPGCNSRRRVITGGYQKRTAQSPREERSLQTSCSLPETPIFARGCDIPRTPHRRAPEVPPHGSGSRTAPRTNSTTSSLGSSVVGISNSGTKDKESKKDKEQHQQQHHQPHHHSQHPQHYHYQQQQQQQHHRDSSSVFLQRSPGSDVTDSRSFPQQSSQHTTPTTQKKKGFFKSFWKKSRHYSLEKQ